MTCTPWGTYRPEVTGATVAPRIRTLPDFDPLPARWGPGRAGPAVLLLARTPSVLQSTRWPWHRPMAPAWTGSSPGRVPASRAHRYRWFHDIVLPNASE